MRTMSRQLASPSRRYGPAPSPAPVAISARWVRCSCPGGAVIPKARDSSRRCPSTTSTPQQELGRDLIGRARPLAPARPAAGPAQGPEDPPLHQRELHLVAGVGDADSRADPGDREDLKTKAVRPTWTRS